jgi:hypothetical protein
MVSDSDIAIRIEGLGKRGTFDILCLQAQGN